MKSVTFLWKIIFLHNAALSTLLLLGSGSAVTAAEDYQANVAKYDAIIRQRPNDESAHYYRAISFQYLGQYTRAKADYEWVVTEAKNPTLVQYANSALKTLPKGGSFSKSTGQNPSAPAQPNQTKAGYRQVTRTTTDIQSQDKSE